MGRKRTFRQLFEAKADIPVEYRLFQSAIMVGIIASFLGTVTSIAISSPVNVLLVTSSLLVLLSVVFYFVRVKGIYKPFIGPSIILSFIGVSIVWIVDGGMNGSNMLVAFVVLILGLIIVPDKSKIYVISYFVALVIGMYLIQLYRPDLITDFESERARWIDGLITATYSALFIFFIIRFLHRSYIIERKKAKDNESKFRALSENSQDCITRYDRQYRHIYVNKAGLLVRGLNQDQLLGKTHRETGIYEEEHCLMFEKLIEKVFTTKQPQHEQFSMDRPDGAVYYDLRLFPEFDTEHELGSVLGVSRDITPLKQSENELLQLNLDKDRFISILGHDLKSPLDTLLGLSALLEENIHSYDISEIKSMLSEMNKSTRVTYQLLEDILTWTKAQSGKIPYNPQALVFKEICENTMEILGPKAQSKDIHIYCQAEDPQTVLADSNMLLTIMRNLLSNAIKFTQKGGEIHVKAAGKPGWTEISVSDNGIGMAPKDQKKLFSLSEIYTTKGTAEEKGTGLGLLLCKEFVEKHGGKIHVESEEGKGSTFRFTLPTHNKQN
jgi:PAS domain S-box-containing protein